MPYLVIKNGQQIGFMKYIFPKETIMKSKYIIILLFILYGCPAPKYDYLVLSDDGYKKEYDLNLENISLTFKGGYRWLGTNSIYTEIGIKINNLSKYEITVDRSKMLLISKYFDYRNTTVNSLSISPKSENSFILEYISHYDTKILIEPWKIPPDEKLSLKPEGFEINGKKLDIKTIYFKPEEIQEN